VQDYIIFFAMADGILRLKAFHATQYGDWCGVLLSPTFLNWWSDGVWDCSSCVCV